KLWHLYDCTDYAANLYNCPTVAYSGEIDKQKQAADIMAEAMKKEARPLVHIIGPKTGHSYHPKAKREINRRIDRIVDAGRDRVPYSLRFTTWTLRYNRVAAIRIDGLQEHWESASIQVTPTEKGFEVHTSNVSDFTLAFPSGQALAQF